jgi:hypothetical protein
MSPTFKPISRLGGVVSFLLAGQVAVCLVGTLPDTFLASANTGAEQSLLAVMVGGGGLVSAIVACTLGTCIGFLAWMHRAADNARALMPNAIFTFTPGGCVGWWFVPFANMVKPFEAMREIHAASLLAMQAQKSEYTPLLGSVVAPLLLQGWWGTWVSSTLMGWHPWVTSSVSMRIIADRVLMKADDSSLPTVPAVLSLMAGILCIVVVREVSSLQTLAGTRTMRVDTSLLHVADAER